MSAPWVCEQKKHQPQRGCTIAKRRGNRAFSDCGTPTGYRSFGLIASQGGAATRLTLGFAVKPLWGKDLGNPLNWTQLPTTEIPNSIAWVFAIQTQIGSGKNGDCKIALLYRPQFMDDLRLARRCALQELCERRNAHFGTHRKWPQIGYIILVRLIRPE